MSEESNPNKRDSAIATRRPVQPATRGFRHHIGEFITHIDGLAETFPITMGAVDASLDKTARHLIELTKTHGEEVETDGKKGYRIDFEHLDDFVRAVDQLNKVRTAAEGFATKFRGRSD